MSQGPTVTNKICVGTGKPRQNWQTSEHERSQTGNPQNIRQTGVSEQGKQIFGLQVKTIVWGLMTNFVFKPIIE